MLTLSIQTYIGNSQNPFPSTHTVPILKNDFDVIMVHETLGKMMVAGVENTIIFQAISIPDNEDANIEHIEFHNAELYNSQGRIQA